MSKQQARTIALPAEHFFLTGKVTFEQAVEAIVVGVAYADEGARILAPLWRKEPERVRSMVWRNLAQQPAYAGQFWLEGTTEKVERGTAGYQALRRAMQRIQRVAQGDVKVDGRTKAGRAQREAQGFTTPAEIAALAAKLVALCGEYEQARKIAAQAIAEAFAAAK